MLYLNGQPLNVTVFPDNTSQVWKLPDEILSNPSGPVRLLWRYSHEGELMHLAQFVELFKGHTTLEITYLPYARQDKEVSNTSTFALRTFARILNELNFDKVIIHDPHSDVALKLIRNSVAKYPMRRVEEVAQQIDKERGGFTIFCYPDKGAVSKYVKIY